MYKQKGQPASTSPVESEYTSPGVLDGIFREAPENMTDPFQSSIQALIKSGPGQEDLLQPIFF